MSEYKTCNKCGQIKPLSEFYRRAKNSDKYLAVCKVCKDSYNLEYQKSYVPKPNSKRAQTLWDRSDRTCLVCLGLYKPITKWQKTCSYVCSYSLQNNKKPQILNTNLCVRCGNTLLHRNNAAIYCSRTCKSLDHNFKHKGRGGGRVTTARRRLIIERDNSKCYLCLQFVEFAHVEIDHLVPRSRGGDSSPSNLSVTCLKCNRSRGNRIGIEQLARLLELRESNDY